MVQFKITKWNHQGRNLQIHATHRLWQMKRYAAGKTKLQIIPSTGEKKKKEKPNHVQCKRLAYLTPRTNRRNAI